MDSNNKESYEDISNKNIVNDNKCDLQLEKYFEPLLYLTEDSYEFDDDLLESLKNITDENVEEEDIVAALDIDELNPWSLDDDKIEDIEKEISRSLNDIGEIAPSIDSICNVELFASEVHSSLASEASSKKRMKAREEGTVKSNDLSHTLQKKDEKVVSTRETCDEKLKRYEPHIYGKYIDFSGISAEEFEYYLNVTNTKLSKKATFPVKLYSILERSEIEGYSNIISFCKHGRSFRIHDQDLFLQKVLRRYSFQTKISSFYRQLTLYGFHRIIGKNNPDRGAIFHELLLRGRPNLCQAITRKEKGIRKVLAAEDEPILSILKPMPFTARSYYIDNKSPSVFATSQLKVVQYTAMIPSRPLNIAENQEAQIRTAHKTQSINSIPYIHTLDPKVSVIYNTKISSPHERETAMMKSTINKHNQVAKVAPQQTTSCLLKQIPNQAVASILMPKIFHYKLNK